MGAANTHDDEQPLHEVYLDSFYISKYLITQGQWTAIMGYNPSILQGNLERPVENISWEDCMLFINRLNASKGQQYRLATEAEWEYAARGGQQSKGFKYAGSDDIDEIAWYWINADEGTQTVGQKVMNWAIRFIGSILNGVQTGMIITIITTVSRKSSGPKGRI